MITFKQYIEEQDEQDEQIESIADIIHRDCQPFIQESNLDIMLWRGFRNLGNDERFLTLLKKQPRTNRKPLSSPQKLHQILDQWFEDRFNFRYRSKGLHTTPNINEASEYGSVRAIIPIGNFRYVWSPLVDDLYVDLNHVSLLNYDERRYMNTNTNSEEPIPEAIQRKLYDRLDELNYIENRLPDAKRTDGEVIIGTESFYAIKRDVITQVYQLLRQEQ